MIISQITVNELREIDSMKINLDDVYAKRRSRKGETIISNSSNSYTLDCRVSPYIVPFNV